MKQIKQKTFVFLISNIFLIYLLALADAKVEIIKYVSDPVELLTKRQDLVMQNRNRAQQQYNERPYLSKQDLRKKSLGSWYLMESELLKRQTYGSPMDIIGSSFLAKRKTRVIPFYTTYSFFPFA